MIRIGFIDCCSGQEFLQFSLLLYPNIIELSLNDSIIINEQEILLIET